MITVPCTIHRLGDRNMEVYFNHLEFYLHNNVTEILNIPVIKDIAQAQVENHREHWKKLQDVLNLNLWPQSWLNLNLNLKARLERNHKFNKTNRIKCRSTKNWGLFDDISTICSKKILMCLKLLART